MRVRKAGFIRLSICIVFFITVFLGCERSPKLYCTGDADSKDYKETGLTLKDVMKHFEKHKISYKYDEQNKVLQFQTAKIYFKDHSSGLVAYKVTQQQTKMDGLGIPSLQPQGDILLDPCKLLSLIKK
jgi:hypothetical protein